MRTSSLLLGSLVLAVSGVVLGFWRQSSDVFDLTKGTLLWVSSLIVLVLLVACFAESSTAMNIEELRHSWPVVLFLVAAWASSMLTSDFIGISVFGEAGRYTSLLSLSSGAVLFLAVRRLSESQIRKLLLVVLVCHVISANYGLVQGFDADPFQWQSGSFGRFVFGTMGNPNFASILASMGTVLSAFFLIDSRSSRPVRIFTGYSLALGVGMLGLFDSFQGNVALLPMVAVVSYALIFSGFPTRTVLLASMISLALIVASLRIDTAGLALGLSLVGALAGGVLHRYLSRPPATKPELHLDKRRAMLMCVGLLVVLAGGAVLLRGTISSGFAGGFVERGDFYRAAWSAFLDRPIIGHGLDTFGKYFTQYRPVGHALNLEPNRTSSVHSVYLGLLFSGGVVLFAAFVAMVIHPILKAFASLKRRQLSTEPLLAGALGSLASLLIVFLVSTEHVAIQAVFFVVLGAVSRLAMPVDFQSAEVPKRVRAQRKRAVRRRVWTGVGVSTVVSLFLLPILLKPFLAARADYLGQVAYFAGNPSQAFYEFQRASDAAPWVSAYRLRTAEIAIELQLPDVARSEAFQVAVRSNFTGTESVKAGRILGLSRDLSSSIFVLEKTYQNDPFALELGTYIQQLAETVAEVAEREGDPELATRARALVDQVVQTRNELTS